MTSGTDPRRVATTGVPQAIASTITMPNGSSHEIGNTRQDDLAYSSRLSAASASPTYSASGPSSGRTSLSKYSCSAGSLSLPARTMRRPARRAASIAVWAPLSGQNRPIHSTSRSFVSRKGKLLRSIAL